MRPGSTRRTPVYIDRSILSNMQDILVTFAVGWLALLVSAATIVVGIVGMSGQLLTECRYLLCT